MKKKPIEKVLTKCPYCGHDEYYVLFSMKGKSVYHYRFDGQTNDQLQGSQKIDNSGMYDNFSYIEYKTIFCSNCNKRLGTKKNIKS